MIYRYYIISIIIIFLIQVFNKLLRKNNNKYFEIVCRIDLNIIVIVTALTLITVSMEDENIILRLVISLLMLFFGGALVNSYIKATNDLIILKQSTFHEKKCIKISDINKIYITTEMDIGDTSDIYINFEMNNGNRKKIMFYFTDIKGLLEKLSVSNPSIRIDYKDIFRTVYISKAVLIAFTSIVVFLCVNMLQL